MSPITVSAVLRTALVTSGAACPDELRDALASSRDLILVATVPNSPTVPRALDALQPDIVVVQLDGSMAAARGRLEEIARISPALVIASPLRSDAAMAFDVGAIDFWPEDHAREALSRTLGRVRARQHLIRDARIGRRLSEILTRRSGTPGRGRVALRSDGMIVLVDPDTIHRIDAVGNYVRVVHAAGPTIVRCTLEALATRLGGSFVRVHRSHVVPIDRIRAVRTSRNRRDVVLADSTTVPLGRRYAAGLEQQLSNAPARIPQVLAAVESLIGGLDPREGEPPAAQAPS